MQYNSIKQFHKIIETSMIQYKSPSSFASNSPDKQDDDRQTFSVEDTEHGADTKIASSISTTRHSP